MLERLGKKYVVVEIRFLIQKRLVKIKYLHAKVVEVFCIKAGVCIGVGIKE